MPDRPSVHEVVAKLQTYGSADQVAQFFTQQGVVGRVDQSHSCPVANYVMRETGKPVSAVQDAIWSDDETVALGGEGPISDFITNFDSGRYPGLVIS